MTPEQRRAWLAERRTGIGASDIAAILGLSRYSNALAVYADKLGLTPEQPSSERMDWGLRLEPAIAAAYSDRTDLATFPGDFTRHPGYGWAFATPDRITQPVKGVSRLVELKNVDARHADDWGEQGSDQVPDAYNLQVQWQMACTGFEVADLAALIGGNELRIYTVERSQTIIDRLIDAGESFWRRVQQRNPPEPDYQHPLTPALLNALYAPQAGKTVMLAEEALQLVADYRHAAEQTTASESLKAEVKGRLIALMGDASEALLPDGTRITRKVIERAGFTTEPTSYTMFRVSKRKEVRV